MSQDEFNDRYNNKRSTAPVKNYNSIINEQAHLAQQTNPVDRSTDRHVEEAASKVVRDEKNKMNNLQILIGTANIQFEDKNKMKISIQNSEGKVYEFKTSGNVIATFKTTGKPEMEYGEV